MRFFKRLGWAALFTVGAPIFVPLTHNMTYRKWFGQVWEGLWNDE